ncbi:MAG: hypothetical protein FPO08_13010 [Geobacter sp.]|nr:MAG: hypothetical protein FPO08_13010 [Geobacter sp.]
MTAIFATVVILIFSSLPVLAADAGLSRLVDPLVTPKLSAPISTTAFFATDRLLTNAGVSFPASDELVFEPELGIGYRGAGQELHGGIEQSTHRLHAQAGWRLSLSRALYLSAGAKFSMLSVETRGLTAGEEFGIRPESGYRNVYEFTPNRTPRWTGELGLHLTPRTDLMLYYDQEPVIGWSYSGQHLEDRLGTRFIFRFK